MAQYDPHNDLDVLKRILTSAGATTAVDRIRNWIDEQQAEQDWNTDITKGFRDQAVAEKMMRETAPLGARGEAVNAVKRTSNDMLDVERRVKETMSYQMTINTLTRLLGGMESVERQMNDVRNKNTALEGINHTLVEQRKVLLSKLNDWERKSVEHDARVDEAYKRGLREGKTEAREEFIHGGYKAFNSD